MDPLLHLDLLVKPGADPIAGFLKLDGQDDVPFTGYLEFMALIERVLTLEPGDDEPP